MKNKRKVSDVLNMAQGNIGSIWQLSLPLAVFNIISRPVRLAIDMASIAITTANIASNMMDESMKENQEVK